MYNSLLISLFFFVLLFSLILNDSVITLTSELSSSVEVFIDTFNRFDISFYHEKTNRKKTIKFVKGKLYQKSFSASISYKIEFIIIIIIKMNKKHNNRNSSSSYICFLLFIVKVNDAFVVIFIFTT
jgi:hypothetical protein